MVELRARRARADGGRFDPGPRRARRRRLRPDVRRLARTAGGAGVTLRRRRDGRRRSRRARSRASGSTSAGSARATQPSAPPTSSPPPDRVSSTPAATSPSAAVSAWPVGVETADGSLTLALERGALATSGTDRRRWTRGGEERHHLIDPRTGPARRRSPARHRLRRRCRRGRGARKILFLGGADEAAESVAAVLVTRRARRSSRAALRETRSDVLAARARERDHRLRARDAFGPRRPGPEVAPVHAPPPGDVTHVHRGARAERASPRSRPTAWRSCSTRR